MKRPGKWRMNGLERPEFRRIMVLSLFCTLGIIFGTITARHLTTQSASELRAYLTAYINLQDKSPDGTAMLRAFSVYFRGCLWLFLLSFCTIGIYIVLLSCAVQSFGLAFSVASFFCCFDDAIAMVLSLFALRAIVLLPTTLYFGSAAMLSAGCGKASRGISFWRCLGICVCILFLGVILELTVVPRIFTLVCSP